MFKMNLLNTSILNGVAILIKIATMFILNKILAIYVGPSGYAVVGQFQNFTHIVTSLSGGVFNNAIVKYTAENQQDLGKQKLIWKTVGTIILLISSFFAILIFLFREWLSLFLFNTIEYGFVFLWFSFSIFLFNFNMLLLSILNGKKEIYKLVLANILGSIISLLVVGYLAFKYNLNGVLVGLCVYQSIAFFVTLLICQREKWFNFLSLFGGGDRETTKKIFKFALMALVTVILGNIAQIILRNNIVSDFGIMHAGYWDAMNKLSGAYLMMATGIMSIYYLPKFSELNVYSEIKKEIFYAYKYILPLAFLSGLSIIFFKDYIINLMFTKNFSPMSDLVVWHVVGDIFKIGSWVISYLMLGKAMVKIYVYTETFFLLSIIPLVDVFCYYFGFQGIAIAYCFNCLIYWLVSSLFTLKKLEVM